jgi:hypothetical protein
VAPNAPIREKSVKAPRADQAAVRTQLDATRDLCNMGARALSCLCKGMETNAVHTQLTAIRAMPTHTAFCETPGGRYQRSANPLMSSQAINGATIQVIRALWSLWEGAKSAVLMKENPGYWTRWMVQVKPTSAQVAAV